MMEFDWDEANIDHVAEHGVEPYEAEEVFYNEHLRSPVYFEEGEERQNLVGPTDAGRLLKVVYTLRGPWVRVCTAYPANLGEVREHRRRTGRGKAH